MDVADSVLKHGYSVRLPQAPAEMIQTDRIITLDYISDLLENTRLSLPASVTSDQHQYSPSTPLPDGSYSGPLYWVSQNSCHLLALKLTLPRHTKVPALPWTNQCTDDASVSHLVSMFLVFQNSWWRQVEEDLLISAMRTKDLNSPYCSPFLVNSILAVASVDFSAFNPPSELTDSR